MKLKPLFTPLAPPTKLNNWLAIAYETNATINIISTNLSRSLVNLFQHSFAPFSSFSLSYAANRAS